MSAAIGERHIKSVISLLLSERRFSPLDARSEHLLHKLLHLELLPVVSFLAQIDCLHAVLSICARRVEDLARGLVGLAFVVDPIRREELADVPVALAAGLHLRVRRELVSHANHFARFVRLHDTRIDELVVVARSAARWLHRAVPSCCSHSSSLVEKDGALPLLFVLLLVFIVAVEYSTIQGAEIRQLAALDLFWTL